MSAHRRASENDPTPASRPAPAESPIPRRLLFTGAAAGLAGAGVLAGAAPAQAAPTTDSWKLGGNSGVTSTGTNFLGTLNAGIPLIFKTKAETGSTVTEKMRLTAQGRLGLGVPAPTARLDAVGSSVGVRGVSTNTGTGGRGVVGVAPSGYGVQGTSTNNVGVQGEGSIGVSGVGSDYGLWGEGSLYGGYFTSSSYGSFGRGTYCGAYGSATDYGVIGTATTVGVYGYGTTGVSGYSSDSNAGNAVLGSGGQYGVHGREGRTAGVRGDSGYVGVWGEGASLGVYGSSSATTGQVYGVYGTTASPGGYAIFSQGRMHVNGTLSKVAGSFRIDHPLDPDNTWLSHSFVESPDMMNVYNGNVVTDATGNATVTLPSYFEALNRDFRYQLTVIGVFAQAVISREVAKGSFDISTDKPKVKVSWQVTGIRQDAYAKEHPIVVETAKTGPERGTRQFTSSTARGATAFPGPDAGGDSIVPEPPKPLPTQQPNDLVPKGSKPSVTKEP